MTILNTIPEKFVGPSAWVGTDLQSRQSEWLYTLTADDISEIEHAARHFLTLGRDVGEITVRDFPLPQFSDHLQNMSEKLLRGIGVEAIRGLPIKSYSQEMAAAIFCGIGAHLGPARSQNAAGHILGHVRDIGADPNDPNARIYQTSARQSFHTDSADVVALMCLQDAKEGAIAFWSVPRRSTMKCVRHGLTYWHCCLIRLPQIAVARCQRAWNPT